MQEEETKVEQHNKEQYWDYGIIEKKYFSSKNASDKDWNEEGSSYVEGDPNGCKTNEIIVARGTSNEKRNCQWRYECTESLKSNA